MRVTGPTFEQLDRRGDEFAALIRREIQATLDWVAPRVDSVDDLVVIRTQWAARIDQRLADHVMKVWWKSADDTHAQLARAGKRAEQSLTAAITIPRVLRSIADLFRVGVKNRLRDIGDLIWNTTREQLILGNLAGESITEIRDRIVATTGIIAPRAEVIARNEVIAASEAGSYEQMQATALDATKEWLATHDGHTRPTHRSVNGEIVDMRGKFIVGGYPMDRPHDPTAPASETINCRCTLLWDIPDDEFIAYDDDALAAAGDWVPGQHPRDAHGKFIKGLGPKHGKKLKITHALVHKKHEPNTVVAVTADGTKQAKWDGSKYNLQRRQDDGSWKTEKTAIKSKAYVEINAYGDDWRESDADDDASPAPSTPPAASTPPSPAPAPQAVKKDATPSTPAPRTAHVQIALPVEPDQPIEVTPDLFKNVTFSATVAIDKSGTHRIVSYGAGAFTIQKKDENSNWVDFKDLTKGNESAEALTVASDWHSPKQAGLAPTVATTTTPVSVYTKSEPDQPLKITPDLFEQDNDVAVLAITKDGQHRLIQFQKNKFWIQRKATENSWNSISPPGMFLDKDAAYDTALYFDDWHTPKEVALPPPAPKLPKSTPVPEATTAINIEPKTYTNLQRAKVQVIFQKKGVKWHNDSKAMYNAALEVSKTHPDLTMGDALVIMDQSLTKKTGDPFQTKITKFLKTNAGKQHALQVGGSAAIGTTEQGTPGEPALNKSISGSPPLPKNLTKADARELQRRMNKAYPPPWNGVQTKALKNYTGSAYTEINNCLRKPGFSHCSESVHKRIANIKAAMKPSTDDVVLYRKTNPPTFGFTSPASLESLVGKTIEDKGVVSTSITKGVWHGSVHLEIEAPKGTRMAYVQPISYHPNEDEIVLAPGTKFEVISVVPHHSFPNDRFVRLRVVPGSGTP